MRILALIFKIIMESGLSYFKNSWELVELQCHKNFFFNSKFYREGAELEQCVCRSFPRAFFANRNYEAAGLSFLWFRHYVTLIRIK